jgi:hypothetical protein
MALLPVLFTGIAFAAMNGIQHLLWDERDQRWYIFGIIMIGAVLIAVTGQFLRRIDSSAADETFDQQLDSLQNTKPRTHTNLLFIAILAIIAVAFGGAIGPEADLVSIVAELSLLVSGVLARSTAEQRLIMESGTAASLAGVYSSPPGAAAFEDDQLTTPKAYTLLAAVAGFVGFFSVNSIFSDGGGLRLHVPAEIVQVDEYAVLLALLPAITAALVSLVYVEFSHQLGLMLGKWGQPVVQTLALSAIFALIAAFYPGMRFSGHHDFGHLVELANTSDWGSLLGFGALKMVCCLLCIRAGWRGGDAFPLMVSGAAVGLASLAVVPSGSMATLMVGGMAAALAVGLRRLLASMLIVVFITGDFALVPALTGAVIGWVNIKITSLDSRVPIGHHSH